MTNPSRPQTNTRALSTFVSHLAKAQDSLKDITALLDDHLGYDPDDITFAHAGTMEHYANRLAELLCELRGKAG